MERKIAKYFEGLYEKHPVMVSLLAIIFSPIIIPVCIVAFLLNVAIYFLGMAGRYFAFVLAIYLLYFGISEGQYLAGILGFLCFMIFGAICQLIWDKVKYQKLW